MDPCPQPATRVLSFPLDPAGGTRSRRCGIRGFRPASALLAVLLALPSCDPSRLRRPRSGELDVRIVVVGEGKTEATWEVLLLASQRIGRIYPAARVDCVSPDSSSPHEQQRLLEGLLEEQVSAVCVAPIEARAIEVVIGRLAASGRPVVTLFRDVRDSSRAVYCGPSEREIGERAAEACDIALRGRARTVMLLHAGDDHKETRGRYYSIKEWLPVKVRDRVTLFGEVDCRADPLEAARLVRMKARRYPRIGCWVFLDDWPLRQLGEEEQILPFACGMVLCNGSPRHLDRMKRGEIQALVTFDHLRAAEEALRAAFELAQPVTDRTAIRAFRPVSAEVVIPSDLGAYEKRWQFWREAAPPESAHARVDP